MPGFGPFYPDTLQEVVNHAERLANLLRHMPVPGAFDAASAWLTGRAEEIACFVGAMTRDWDAKRLSSDKCASGIGTYLDTLHRDLSARLGIAAPRCCSVVPELTSEPLTCFSRTVTSALRPHLRDPVDPKRPGTTSLLLGLDRRWVERNLTSSR
jgi:hypothetical protein